MQVVLWPWVVANCAGPGGHEYGSPGHAVVTPHLQFAEYLGVVHRLMELLCPRATSCERDVFHRMDRVSHLTVELPVCNSPFPARCLLATHFSPSLTVGERGSGALCSSHSSPDDWPNG